MSKISVINWNKDIKLAPPGENLLVVYHNDSYDYPSDDVIIAWRISGVDIWIYDNEQLYTPGILMWAKLPEAKNIIEV